MIRSLSLLLLFQLGGEVLARGAGLPLPGPVIGLAALFAALSLFPTLAEMLWPTARGFLQNLSLLFVPAGVGVVAHLDRLGTEGPGLMLAIAGSTLLALLAGVGAFLLVARMTGSEDV